MAEILPKITARIGEFPGVQVLIDLPDLSSYKKTFISSDEASGQTALSVESSENFAANEYIVIEEPGAERAELRLISTATGNVITVSAATTFAHSKGTIIRFIPYNQIQIQNDTDSAFGTATTTTIALQVDTLQIVWEDIDGTSATYYRARFYHEQGTRASSYSDTVIATGFGTNTVAYLRQQALNLVNEEIGGIITNEKLNQALFQARNKVHNTRKRWSWRMSYNTDIGNASTGIYRIAMPTDLQDQFTDKNIFNVWIGTERKMERMSKEEFNEWFESIAHTTLASNYTVTDATITLTNSRDFDETGTIVIAGDSIVYSANNESTGALTVSTDGASNHTAGDDVWLNTDEGIPTKFTAFDGYIYFNCPLDDDLDAENIYCDYYKTVKAVNSDADTLDEPEVELFIHYLAWFIKKLKNPSLDVTDVDYKLYQEGLARIIQNETLGREISLVPNIEWIDEGDYY